MGAWRQSWLSGPPVRRTFAEVERFCLFIGYPRSGHSLVGSLLDAHREAIIAHEADVLQYLQFGLLAPLFSRAQIFQLLLENSRQYAAGGRSWREFDYHVQGQFQGSFERLRVIGDKKGATSSIRLRRYPALARRLERKAACELRYVHVVRNPFDNIATMSRKTRIPLERACRRYFRLCRTNAAIRREVGPRLIDIRQERIISHTREEVSRLCTFLGLEAAPGYLDACAGLVYANPHQSRHDAEWPAGLVEQIQSQIADFDFLAGYTFND